MRLFEVVYLFSFLKFPNLALLIFFLELEQSNYDFGIKVLTIKVLTCHLSNVVCHFFSMSEQKVHFIQMGSDLKSK